MKIYLFDSLEIHQNLLPLSFTRPVADFRCGIITIREKWEKYLPGDYGFYPVEYLRDKFGTVRNQKEEAIFIAGNLIPRPNIVKAIQELKSGEAIFKSDAEVSEKANDTEQAEIPNSLLVYKGTLKNLKNLNPNNTASHKTLNNPPTLSYLYDIFLRNGEEIIRDFQLITKGRRSQPLPPHVHKISSGPVKGLKRLIFIEEGAKVECASVNISRGPIYIGKNASVMEGTCIRGPFAICQEAEVRMGAKIYEGTTIGPKCKVGGEVTNSVFFGFSNKAHDGFLGNAVIGEWCNIGAGTNASNLKNDYSLIRVWNYRTQYFMKTDLQFCGLIMGDHSKIGINCMINTATVIGVGANIHGSGFPRQFVPCFCEGSPNGGFTKAPLKKILDIATRAMARRDISLTTADASLLSYIYEK